MINRLFSHKLEFCIVPLKPETSFLYLKVETLLQFLCAHRPQLALQQSGDWIFLKVQMEIRSEYFLVRNNKIDTQTKATFIIL